MTSTPATVTPTGDPAHPAVPQPPAAPSGTPAHSGALPPETGATGPAPGEPTAGPLLREGGAHWYPAEGLVRRGTVVLLHGRGEHPGVYERFGRRLSADAYVVHVLDAWPDREPAELAAAVDALAAAAALPLVLAGSDTGALHALAAAVRTTTAPDALLLAGVPQLSPATDGGAQAGALNTPAPATTALGTDTGTQVPGDADWTGELDARTACPAHLSFKETAPAGMENAPP